MEKVRCFRSRCMLHSEQIGGLLDFFAATPLRRDMLRHTTSFVEQATRQFFYKNSTYDERISLVKAHVEFLESKLTEDALRRLYADGEMLRLWEDSYEEKPLTLELWFHAGQRKEGCLSLVLMWDKEALYQIMFWLAPGKNGEPALWIGALQGTPNGSEVIKGLTKAFTATAPKSLIFYGIRNVAAALGCESIYAVSNEGYYAMNHIRVDRKLKTSLDAFWQECEGTQLDDKRFLQNTHSRIQKIHGGTEAFQTCPARKALCQNGRNERCRSGKFCKIFKIINKTGLCFNACPVFN